MADARIAVATPFVRKEEDGTASTYKDLYRSYRLILLRNYFRLRNSIRNGMWPTSSTYLIVACGFSTYLLEFKPSRFASVSQFLCSVSEKIPFPEETPLWLHHIIFSAGVSVAFFLGLMKLRQYALRILFSYRGWMYETAKTQSFTTIFWALMVRFISGYQPSLYSFQNSLPRMPVPSLHDTMEKLLESLEPLCTDEEFLKYQKGVKELEETIGNKLQRLLCLKSWMAPNYVSDWWEKYAYLRSRLPLAINSNYYVVDHYIWTPTKIQPSRAANVLHSILYMKRLIEREQLSPLVLRNTIPVCMSQYERVFSSYRNPGKEMDEMLHFESSESKIVIVSCQNLLYCVTVYDHANQILSASTLEKIFQDIITDANNNSGSVGDLEKHVPALTALNRSEWADIMEQHFSYGLNAESLDTIKKAICSIVLYDKVPENLSEKGKLLLHGDGGNIWFDKCFNIGFFPDGKCGMNVEHTMADAPVLGHVWEYAMSMEVVEKRYLDSGVVMPPPKSYRQRKFIQPYRLHWNISQPLGTEIARAFAFSKQKNDDLDLMFYNHEQFGKGFIKKAKISPDAFIQIALQLAYYRDSGGKFCQTYEACATRLYQHGRTETVRSCTKQSCAFVRAICAEEKLPKGELINLLHAASDKHRQLYRDATNGKGIDRHIFALYVVSKGLGYDNKFMEDILSRPWTLSTSQQPQQQMQLDMPDINLDAFRKMVGPGGGFGPVSDEGYGVSYMLPTEYNIFFHVSSKKSCTSTSSQRMVQSIIQSMEDMKLIFQ